MAHATNPTFITALNNLFTNARNTAITFSGRWALELAYELAYSNSAAVLGAIPGITASFSIAQIIAALEQILPTLVSGNTTLSLIVDVALGLLSTFFPTGS